MSGFHLPLAPAESQTFLQQASQPGACFLFPTESFYALGCFADDETAVAEVYHLKQRALNQPLLVLVSGFEMLARYTTGLNDATLEFLKAHWPGPLSVILPACGLAANLNALGPWVAFRFVAHSELAALIEQSGRPWVGTSANRSGAPPCTHRQEAQQQLGGLPRLWLDSGPCPGGLPSTLVDLRQAPRYRVLRPGALELPAEGMI
ncbi:MAG: L-threonylcarbamoyladenylate synthase [bacterium]|nr:L-threonylcarbamoyladenylate synthase [bacterium]